MVHSRAIEERVADELHRWQAGHADSVPAFVTEHIGDVARDTGLAFALGYIDAIAFGLTGPRRHDGCRPLVSVTRLRIATPPYPEVAPVGPTPPVSPQPTETTFGVWLRPTARGRSADIPYFLSVLRLGWETQPANEGLIPTARLQVLTRFEVDDGIVLLREGFGDVIG
jgi:hypothetical protein